MSKLEEPIRKQSQGQNVGLKSIVGSRSPLSKQNRKGTFMNGKMPHLTANQAIVLLEIHRGTFDSHRRIGTTNDDLILLFKMKYIEIEDGVYSTTSRGHGHVTYMLN